jgi:hypothetical protein
MSWLRRAHLDGPIVDLNEPQTRDELEKHGKQALFLFEGRGGESWSRQGSRLS